MLIGGATLVSLPQLPFGGYCAGSLIGGLVVSAVSIDNLRESDVFLAQTREASKLRGSRDDNNHENIGNVVDDMSHIMPTETNRVRSFFDSPQATN